jgi:glyoxylase-like metal-dependent hydrolase (beta-lactamase superfamily II)
MNNYIIRPLRLGTISRKKENMSYGCGVTDIIDFPLISYYLEGAGHKIIVDTGGSPPDGVKWQPYHRTENECLGKSLQSIGVSPEEIDIVILTHLHWDHASNNHIFPNAQFIVQKKEYDYLTAPQPEIKVGYELDLVLQTKYELVDGDTNIVPGIHVVLAPGHSTGMQCVVVDTRAGKYILGGDLITLFENWEAEPHVPNGIFYDLNIMLESLEKIDRLNGIVLPGHDQEVFNRSNIYPPE